MRKKCLITGVDGLLGSHLISHWEGDELYIVSKRKTSFYPSDCHVIHADLTDEKCDETFPEKIDAVIHLAQSNHFREFPEKSVDIANVNTFSTLRLLDYAKRAKAKHFIYASTGGVYPSGPEVFQEDCLLKVQKQGGIYYASKLAGELFVDAYSQIMTTVTLRFFFMYGPRQHQSMLIPRLVQSVVEGNSIKLQGEDGLSINPIYVADAVRAVQAALQLSTSETINVAGSEVLSLKEIGLLIEDHIGKPAIFENDFSKAPSNLIASIEKMKTFLIAPEIDFQRGLELYLQEAYPLITRN